jgi:hypothetical protein
LVQRKAWLLRRTARIWGKIRENLIVLQLDKDQYVALVAEQQASTKANVARLFYAGNLAKTHDG